MRIRLPAIFLAVLLLMQFSLSQVLDTATALAAGTGPCHDPTPAKYLPANDSVAAVPDPAVLAVMASKIGSAGDTELANRDLNTGSVAAITAERARKDTINATVVNHGSMTVLPDRATLARECGRVTGVANAVARLANAAVPAANASYGSGYRWLDWMNQQGQQQNTWCGPATVSEMATTEANNGRLSGPVNQSDAAGTMATDLNGTSVPNEVAGINRYVAQPIVHRDYYSYVWISGSTDPTIHNNEVNTFYSNLDYDLRNGWAIGGDGWEVPYGVHLVGHPAWLDIKHWFQIGGYQSYGSSTYYSDSATTTGWSGVQPFSWYDTSNLIYIFGGFGYAW